MHGLQEGHRDYNSPVISTRTEITTRKHVVLFLFYLPFTLTSPFMKKKRLSQPAGRDKRFLFYCAPKRILKS